MKNNRDDGNYGYKELDWEIKFGDIMDEKWSVKSSLEEKSDNSMKTNEEGLIEDGGWMLLTSCCFKTLTTNPIIF